MASASGHSGVSSQSAEQALNQIASSKSLLFSGIHVHIGSQIKDPERYKLAMSSCSEFMNSNLENISDVGAQELTKKKKNRLGSVSKNFWEQLESNGIFRGEALGTMKELLTFNLEKILSTRPPA